MSFSRFTSSVLTRTRERTLNNEKSALISLLDECDCDELLMLLLLLALAMLAGFDDIEGSLLFSTTVDRQISSSLAAFAALFVAGSTEMRNREI